MSAETNSEFSRDTLRELEQAVVGLRNGQVVAIPTETVYGLAADADNLAAVQRIFQIKGRPADHPLIVHLADRGQIADWAVEIPDYAWQLATEFWPGPLTLILPKRSRVLSEVTGGYPTVGLRVPDHPLTLRLLQMFGGGVAAPSANRFTRVSPTTAAHVRMELGSEVDFILDGGPCRVGIESTIVDCSGPSPVLLRPGMLELGTLQRVVPGSYLGDQRRSTASPGQHPIHYSPECNLRGTRAEDLVEEAHSLAAQGHRVAVLSLRPPPEDRYQNQSGVTWWVLPQDSETLARGLYGRLRDLDEQGFTHALVEWPLPPGIAAAIQDRLARATRRNQTH